MEVLYHPAHYILIFLSPTRWGKYKGGQLPNYIPINSLTAKNSGRPAWRILRAAS